MLDSLCNSLKRFDTKENFKNDRKDVNNQEVGMNDFINNLHTLTSNRTSSPGIKDNVSESFVPFSQQTSLTHIPALYEELIQKYEGDIRNHIRIEQQMKLHSDSVVSKHEKKLKKIKLYLAQAIHQTT